MYNCTVDACHKETLKIVFLTHRNDFRHAVRCVKQTVGISPRGERRQQRWSFSTTTSRLASRAGLSSLQLCLQPKDTIPADLVGGALIVHSFILSSFHPQGTARGKAEKNRDKSAVQHIRPEVHVVKIHPSASASVVSCRYFLLVLPAQPEGRRRYKLKDIN